MGYVISDSIKNAIRQIPKFRTDVYKIKSISSVKSIYQIGSGETILAYRVVPKLLAKIETGGTVFTDQGVYKRLPSGVMKNDYVTYGVKYEDFIYYIPFLGYSTSDQPELVGAFSDRYNRSFWLSPLMNSESNSEMVTVFDSILQELLNDDEKKDKFEETVRNMIRMLYAEMEKDGWFLSSREKILTKIFKKFKCSDEIMRELIYLKFANNFARNRYSDAYDFIYSVFDYVRGSDLWERLNKIERDCIQSIISKDELSYDDADTLKILCKQDSSYIEWAFPYVVSFYFGKGDNEYIDRYLQEFSDEKKSAKLIAVVEKQLSEKLDAAIELWNANNNDTVSEKLVLYAMKYDKFHVISAKASIEHYCTMGMFDKAKDLINTVREIKNDNDFIEELNSLIYEYTIIYAKKQYEQAQELLSSENKKEAIVCLQKAVEYDPQKQEYALCLIQTEIDMADYSLAKKEITRILPNIEFFDENGLQVFRKLEVECAEGITQEMGAFYDLIANNNATSLNNDYTILSKVDQFGMNFYHYAVLLKCDDLISKVDVSGNLVRQKVGTYDLFTFGVGDENVSVTFVQMLKMYDEDAKKLYKNYKRKKAANTAKNIGAGILNSMVDSAISSASRVDSNLRKMERDDAYYSRRDEISAKRDEVRDRREQMKEMRSQLRDYSDSKIQSGDELYEEYENNLFELANEKIIYWANKLDESVDNNNLKSKLIYLILKNPSLLDNIFHGDRSGFALHEEDGDFWYLPEEILVEAKELHVEYVQREILVPKEVYDEEYYEEY